MNSKIIRIIGISLISSSILFSIPSMPIVYRGEIDTNGCPIGSESYIKAVPQKSPSTNVTLECNNNICKFGPFYNGDLAINVEKGENFKIYFVTIDEGIIKQKLLEENTAKKEDLGKVFIKKYKLNDCNFEILNPPQTPSQPPTYGGGGGGGSKKIEINKPEEKIGSEENSGTSNFEIKEEKNKKIEEVTPKIESKIESEGFEEIKDKDLLNDLEHKIKQKFNYKEIKIEKIFKLKNYEIKEEIDPNLLNKIKEQIKKEIKLKPIKVETYVSKVKIKDENGKELNAILIIRENVEEPVVEIIPKEIASSASLIEVISGDMNVLVNDPVIQFSPSADKKYSYMIKEDVDLDKVKKIPVYKLEEETIKEKSEQNKPTQSIQQPKEEKKEKKEENKGNIALIVTLIVFVLALLGGAIYYFIRKNQK